MNICIKNVSENEIRADILILPLFEEYSTDIYADLDLLVNGLVSTVINSKDFTGKHGQTMLLPVKHINSSRLLLAGMGKRDQISQERIRQSGSKAFSAVRELGAADIAVSTKLLRRLPEGNPFIQKPILYFLEGGILGMYWFQKYKTEGKEKGKREIFIGHHYR